jgi:hypothetical protein
MGADSWMDAFSNMLGTIAASKSQPMNTYSMIGKNNIPDALTKFPSALTFIDDVTYEYSLGGPNYAFWQGQTEIHVFPNVSRKNYSILMKYYEAILVAFATHVTLGGKVVTCMLRQTPSIQGPLSFTYGNDDPHHGFLINWSVKEKIKTGLFSFGG